MNLILSIGRKSIKKYIKNVRYFQDEQGKFSKNKFIEILKHAGITEDEYLDNIWKVVNYTGNVVES